MFCFTIALRGKDSTNNWQGVQEDFNCTLRSIFNQSTSEFEVYVACNDIPEVTENYDDRLHFIPVQTEKPQNWLDCCRDRAWKQLVCSYEIYQNYRETLETGDGIFVFPVDADDYVSRKIVAYTEEHSEAFGFNSKKGYRLVKGSKIMEVTPYFGGTMNVMKLFKDDFPVALPDSSCAFDKETCISLNSKYPVRWNDIEVAKKFAEIQRPFQDLPFPSTIYVVGTGENISVYDPNNRASREKKIHLGVLLKKLSPLNKKLLTEKVKKEFGVV